MKQTRKAPPNQKWCSGCKTFHPFFTIDEDGNKVETFSRSKRNGYQAMCKKSASAYNVEQQRIRRMQQREFRDSAANKTMLHETKAINEFNSLVKVTEYHGHKMHVNLSDVETLFDRFSYKCPVCDSPYINIAHEKTLERGGKSEIGNLVPLCNLHKIAKGHRTLREWANNSGFVIENYEDKLSA